MAIKDDGSDTTPLTASALRASIAEKEAKEAASGVAKTSAADAELKRLFKEFLEEQLSQKELDEMRGKILRATEEGHLEVQVMRFPSDICTDRGKAINNAETGWPGTLRGKAKTFYNFFLERGQPQGFGLKAKIVDFPNGMPGDVGLFVTWK